MNEPLQRDLFMPDYTLRKSRRAKHIHINITPDHGIELVIPHRAAIRQAKQFLHDNEKWINRQLSRLAPRPQTRLPETIHLEAIDHTLQVDYCNDDGKRCRYREARDGSRLLVIAGSDQQYLEVLHKWLRNCAKRILPEMLKVAAARTGINYRRLSVRSQKTRWGSCSSAGHISLNDRLLFLSRETVMYVMIHELCHLRHMNHSRSFWQLVAKYCPDYEQHETVLDRARSFIPDWA